MLAFSLLALLAPIVTPVACCLPSVEGEQVVES